MGKVRLTEEERKERQRLRDKSYYIRNKERILLQKKEYHKKNRKILLLKRKKYVATNRDRVNEELRKYYMENKQYYYNRNRVHNLSRYGVTVDQYNKLFDDQMGCCKMCGVHQSNLNKVLHVDHDHKTGKVRGLLCQNCNTLLGYAHDDITLLEEAIKYLKITQ